MERRALGKGISALIPEREVAREEKIIYVTSDEIRPNPFQPREDFDEASIAELAQSIKEKGLIQPLLVRRKGESFELIAGERRLRASKLLNLKEIPIIVREVNDEDSLELALIENIQREKLNPIEEAHAFQYLMEKFKLTQEKISEAVGKSRVTITNTLRLLKLPQEIQAEMKKGRISFAHGRALLEIEDVNRQRRLVQDIIAKGLSVRELENLLRAHRPTKRRMNKRHDDIHMLAIEEKIQQLLGTKARITKRKKGGHITIDFYSPDDLERIITRLIKGAV